MDTIKTIIELRKQKGLTQSLMAEKLGIAPNNYGKIEKGITEMTLNRLNQIAEILNVSVVELLTGKPQTVQNDERVTELKERIRELEDRVKDKQFKIDAIEREARIFEILVFEALTDSVRFSDKIEDYVQVIEDNKWLIPFLTGIPYNSLKIKNLNWKKYWSKAIEIVINRINALSESNPNPDETLSLAGTYLKKKYKRNRDIFNDERFQENHEDINFLWYYRPNDSQTEEPNNEAQKE
jgi:transcriptional regulator with XRE-family HTH domain